MDPEQYLIADEMCVRETGKLKRELGWRAEYNDGDMLIDFPNDPGCASVKIVMLTAKGRDTEVAKGLAIGADAYVTKPFSTKDLLAQVKQILGEAE